MIEGLSDIKWLDLHLINKKKNNNNQTKQTYKQTPKKQTDTNLAL